MNTYTVSLATQGLANTIINHGKEVIFNESRLELQKTWSETSFQIQLLRDNPECARSEFELLSEDKLTRLFAKASFAV